MIFIERQSIPDGNINPEILFNDGKYIKSIKNEGFVNDMFNYRSYETIFGDIW